MSLGAGEMNQLVGAPAALPQDPGSIPSSSQPFVTPFQRIWCSLLASGVHVLHRHACNMQTKYPYPYFFQLKMRNFKPSVVWLVFHSPAAFPSESHRDEVESSELLYPPEQLAYHWEKPTCPTPTPRTEGFFFMEKLERFGARTPVESHSNLARDSTQTITRPISPSLFRNSYILREQEVKT